MSTSTTNYSLVKPDLNETADIGVINSNMDTIDNKMKSIESSTNYVRQPGYAVDSGSANAYLVTLSPAPTSYIDGMCIAVKIANSSTGASTINVNNLGAKNILDGMGNAIVSGQLVAGYIYTLRYNGTNFIIQGKDSAKMNGSNVIANDAVTFENHENNSTRHITSDERTAWNGKQDALPVENRRKITYGTADPSGGSDGDIYLQYEA